MGLTDVQEILVRLLLLGGPQYKAGVAEAAAATGLMTKEQQKLAVTQGENAKRSWAHNQAMFTARRFAFYGTLGMAAAGFEALRMGFRYNSAMQTASIALQPVIHGHQNLQKEMGTLFDMAAASPFQFKDLTTSFRTMYAQMHPFGYGVGQVNTTLQNLMNSLAYSGKTSPQNLNRITTALSHMVAAGRPMGQMITNLARDNVPIYAALATQFNLSAQQIAHIGTSGLTSAQVIAALNNYLETTPGYIDAAVRQTHSLQGAWTTFKDFLSQGVGGAEGGIFSGLTRALVGVNTRIFDMTKTAGGFHRNVTLTDFINAIDQQLTPKTHVILNLFLMLEATVKTILTIFMGIYWVIQQIGKVIGLIPFFKGGSGVAFQVMGVSLGVFLVGLIAAIAAVKSLVLVFDLLKIALLPFKGLFLAMQVATGVQDILGTALGAGEVSGGLVGFLAKWKSYALAPGEGGKGFANVGPMARFGRTIWGDVGIAALLGQMGQGVMWLSKITGISKLFGDTAEIGGVGNTIKSIAATFKDEGFVAGIKSVGGAMNNLWSAVLNCISSFAVLVGTSIKSAAVAVWNFATTQMKALWTVIADTATAIYGALIPALLDLIGVETIADILNPLMWAALVVGVIATLGVLYWRWKAFHDAVNTTFQFLKDHWIPVLVIALTLFGFITIPIMLWAAIGYAIYKAWGPFLDLVHTLWGYFKDIVNWLKGPLGGILGFIQHPIGTTQHWLGITPTHGALPVATHQLPGMLPYNVRVHSQDRRAISRHGGVYGATGQIINNAGPVNPVTGAGLPGMLPPGDINVNLVVDRQILAKAVARANQDYAARK
jgi:tape measure domain-containing protein